MFSGGLKSVTIHCHRKLSHDKFAKIKAVRKVILSYLHHCNSSVKRRSDIFFRRFTNEE